MKIKEMLKIKVKILAVTLELQYGCFSLWSVGIFLHILLVLDLLSHCKLTSNVIFVYAKNSVLCYLENIHF